MKKEEGVEVKDGKRLKQAIFYAKDLEAGTSEQEIIEAVKEQERRTRR